MKNATGYRMAGLALLGALHATGVMAGDDQFVGEIICGAWDFAPRGTLLAQGQLVPIAQNTALFSLLGTTYGGNGMNNFALPDLRGRTMVNAGQGVGLSVIVQGDSRGVEAQSLTIAQLPTHVHVVAPLGSTLDASLQSPVGNVPASKVRTEFFASATAGATMAATPTSVTGQGAPVNNMQPYVTTNCVIATVGIFPSRP